MLQTDAIQLSRVSLRFAESDEGALFEDFSLGFASGKITVLMGGSGSGKTTLARISSGRIAVPSGIIERCSSLSAPADCVYVDQDAWNSVFPYRTVEQNLNWTLAHLGWKSEIASIRTAHLLSAFDLAHKKAAYPRDLSGGQRQRLALLRCLVWEPKCMIMDESLSALDDTTKNKVIDLLISEVRTRSMTLIHVTHNPMEALALADHIVVIGGRPARIQAEFEGGFQETTRTRTTEFEQVQSRLMAALRNAV